MASHTKEQMLHNASLTSEQKKEKVKTWLQTVDRKRLQTHEPSFGFTGDRDADDVITLGIVVVGMAVIVLDGYFLFGQVNAWTGGAVVSTTATAAAAFAHNQSRTKPP